MSTTQQWLAVLLTLGALLQATMILITQNRQDTRVDQMRQVHPDLEDGTDPQVEALKETVDPHQSLKTLEQLLEEDNEQVQATPNEC